MRYQPRTTTLSRRSLLLSPFALLLAPRFAAAQGRMSLCLHTNTSAGAGYRGALEGWAKAGIRQVELNAALIDEFLKGDTLARGMSNSRDRACGSATWLRRTT